MRPSTPVTALLLLGLVPGGCSDGNGLLLVQDVGSLTVTVDSTTGATTPTYGWDGAGARSLVVTRADGTAVVWRLEAVDIDVGFPPPVRQGVVPQGARQTTVGDLLQTGVGYRVRVEDVDGASGSVTFRP